ncbi:hypothetical protein L2449_09450 [Mesorhizobium muleiense]|uniref:hypothetical protein n=1 Tax=Mesorhizobium muleiense TaxID=1004279 RepID=UPI001F23E37E|nr:hypothetical protein [Mesorhizobium muleiense]MCF6117138.1 hypothetical protein [Mesorhizobium muleiense]
MKIKDIIYRDIDEVPLAEYVEAFSFLVAGVDDKNLKTDVDAQNAKSKYLITYECYRILISLLIVFLAIFANLIISANVQLDYESVMRGSAFIEAWPWNKNIFLQFMEANQLVSFKQRNDYYWFSYLCSVTSSIWILWMFWRISVEFRRADRMNVSGSEYAAVLRAICILLVGTLICFLAAKANFSEGYSFYAPSLKDGVVSYSIKKVLLISGFYVMCGLSVFVISMLFRYRRI